MLRSRFDYEEFHEKREDLQVGQLDPDEKPQPRGRCSDNLGDVECSRWTENRCCALSCGEQRCGASCGQEDAKSCEHYIDENSLTDAEWDLYRACKLALCVTGGSEYWDGETKEFLLLMERAVAKAESR